ncbi:MAG: glycosyltransferase family 4 protein [Candidatus Aenigmarchaeota archaeon]|nr:glycosyltransferase family 4 protein [Candidatus Aenigmarchaeota archaeon]
MKITMVGYTIPQSNINGASRGIARYIYYTGSELVKMGHDVNLFVRDDVKPPEKWIKTISAPKVSWIPYPMFVYKKIRGVRSDVFHADYVNTGAPLIWAKKRPAVVAIHDVLPFSYDKKDLTVMDKVRVAFYMRNFKSIEKADAIILASECARNEAIEKTRIPEEKIHAVHYGIDSEMLKPAPPKNHDKIRIGYIGGLDGRKNVTLLIECFKKISRGNKNVELHLAGTGRNFEKFEEMEIPNMFLHGDVKYKDVPSFLNSLDVFVFPTLGEGFGLPVCEAMACGVPVVASNVSTMPEIVGDSGILSDPTVADMSESIERLVVDKNLRRKIGKRGLERSKEFTWKKAAEKTVGIYEEVMK